MNKLEALKDRLFSATSRYNLALQTVITEKSKLKESRLEIKVCEESQKILQEIAQKVQQTAHNKIASVVSRCLAAVFDDPYEFQIEFVKRRGKTEADLYFTKDGRRRRPLKGSGGGVADLAAFGLRLACMVLSKPRRRRILVLDEPFKGVHSKVYRERVRQLIEALSHEMDVQIILVTGIDELRTGKVIEIK